MLGNIICDLGSDTMLSKVVADWSDALRGGAVGRTATQGVLAVGRCPTLIDVAIASRLEMSVVIEDDIPEDFEPSEEEITEYARWLGTLPLKVAILAVVLPFYL